MFLTGLIETKPLWTDVFTALGTVGTVIISIIFSTLSISLKPKPKIKHEINWIQVDDKFSPTLVCIKILNKSNFDINKIGIYNYKEKVFFSSSNIFKDDRFDATFPLTDNAYKDFILNGKICVCINYNNDKQKKKIIKLDYKRLYPSFTAIPLEEAYPINNEKDIL